MNVVRKLLKNEAVMSYVLGIIANFVEQYAEEVEFREKFRDKMFEIGAMIDTKFSDQIPHGERFENVAMQILQDGTEQLIRGTDWDEPDAQYPIENGV